MEHMIGWGWLILAFFVGSTLGVLTMALCVSNATSRDVERIIDLRVALGDLVRAVDGERVDRQSEFLRRALARAREVLDR